MSALPRTPEGQRPVQRRAGIVVWEGPRPVDDVEQVRYRLRRTGPCDDCGKPCLGRRCRSCNNAAHRSDVPASVRRRRRRHAARIAALRLSPEDRAWAERNAMASSWMTREYYQATTKEIAA